jgi:hypothetical protein
MVRARASLILILSALAGCGGRDPLFGGIDDAPPPGPPVSSVDAGGPRPRDAAFQSPTPGPTRDGSIALPPTPIDAAPIMTPPGSCAPSCLAKLERACPGTGRCVQQRAMGRNAGSNVCWANGVKAQSVNSMGQLTILVTNPDGTLCYFVEMSNSGGVRALTYTNANRQVIARATLEGNCFSTVTCTGETNPQATMSACLPALAAVGSTTCAPACGNGTCM